MVSLYGLNNNAQHFSSISPEMITTAIQIGVDRWHVLQFLAGSQEHALPQNTLPPVSESLVWCCVCLVGRLLNVARHVTSEDSRMQT